MLIKFLKRGAFSVNPVFGPIIQCIKNEEADLPDNHALRLIKYKWAEAVADAIDASTEQEPEPVETIDTEIEDNATPALSTIGAPWEVSDWNPKAKDAKSILEQYGKTYFGIDVDRRKSVANIIKQLKKVAI